MTSTRRREQTHSRPPPLGEHDPDCLEPGMLWQGVWQPEAPRLGYCRSCGAPAVTTPAGTSPPETIKEREPTNEA